MAEEKAGAPPGLALSFLVLGTAKDPQTRWALPRTLHCLNLKGEASVCSRRVAARLMARIGLNRVINSGEPNPARTQARTKPAQNGSTV